MPRWCNRFNDMSRVFEIVEYGRKNRRKDSHHKDNRFTTRPLGEDFFNRMSEASVRSQYQKPVPEMPDACVRCPYQTPVHPKRSQSLDIPNKAVRGGFFQQDVRSQCQKPVPEASARDARCLCPMPVPDASTSQTKSITRYTLQQAAHQALHGRHPHHFKTTTHLPQRTTPQRTSTRGYLGRSERFGGS